MKWSTRTALPLSREGLLWFIISCAMLVTGLLKGINLITLLACWMVTLVVLNYCWAFPQLRVVKARRFFPEAAFAQTPCNFLLQVENCGRKAAFGVAVHDTGADHHATRFLPRLDARAFVSLNVRLVLSRRGRYRLRPLQLTTGYPLALVHLAKVMKEGDDLVVFPKLGLLHRGPLRRFLAQHSPSLGQARTFPRRYPGAQTEFHGLRPFRPGDSPRWVHWRTTARRGELMVREFEDMPTDHLVLIVDPGAAESPDLERLLSLAATICWEWCRQKGNRLAVAVAGPEPAALVGNTGQEFAYEVLERLALIVPGSRNGDVAFLAALGAQELPPGPVLLLTAADSGLIGLVAQGLHRSVAQLNLGAGEDGDYFEP